MIVSLLKHYILLANIDILPKKWATLKSDMYNLKIINRFLKYN